MLFTFVGDHGHFEPLLPIARAAEAAGHVVAFACGASMAAVPRSAGFETFTLDGEGSPARERLPLLAYDRAREERHLRDRFIRRAARARVPRLRDLCETWRPQVLVCDETDFGTMLAAERSKTPHATVQVIAAGGFLRKEAIGPALDELRAEIGLAPDPDLEMLARYLVLSPFPPRYRDPSDPLPDTAHPIHPGSAAVGEDGAARLPAKALPSAETLYLTLGSVFNTESGDLLARLIAGLSARPANLIVTVGRHIDPRELGPQPAHVHIERFVPQSALLPVCDAVVCHAGSGSVMGALANGLPSLLLPIGADQPLNAARCAALGVARVVDPMQATAEGVRAEVGLVLDVPSYRHNAERLRDEIASLPGPARAVSLLEELAAEGRPIPFEPAAPTGRSAPGS